MKLKPLMIQGTMSNSGKTFVVAGLCRIFQKDGYRCAPFKSQNMALNSYITRDGWEIGRAQAMQAEAAMVEPMVEMNPIMLKPNSDMGSQVIVNGEVLGNFPAAEYYKMKEQLKPTIQKAFHTLEEQFDVIVLEGAGSPAEINLKENDIVNMGMAEMADADVLLVADIDRGGVFASVYGTIQLLEPEERKRIKGIIINKFRGDVEILKPGLEMIEQLTGIPVIGVIPYEKIDLDDEDSLSEQLMKRKMGKGIDVAVIRLPHISNFTDFRALEMEEQVSLRYVTKKEELGNPDVLILPGTKNTMYDLKWLRESGIEARICRIRDDCRIIGICGGYQMMGELLQDPDGIEHGGVMKGIGLLPVQTVFAEQKTRGQKRAVLKRNPSMMINGYEIHMGKTSAVNQQVEELLHLEDGTTDGFCTPDGKIWGSYFHGIFDNDLFRREFLAEISKEKGIEEAEELSFEQYKEEQYDRLEQLIRNSVDIERIYRLLQTRSDEEESPEKGCVHLYYGDGKGKTSAAVGLAVRAAGAGKKVLIYQFLKNNSSSERKCLDLLQGITCIRGPEMVTFTSRMTEEERREHFVENNRTLQEIFQTARQYDVLILDEAIYAIDLGQLSEEPLIDYIENRPNGQEVILTGRNPSKRLMECADYCSCIVKERHPFDRGLAGRRGIEY